MGNQSIPAEKRIQKSERLLVEALMALLADKPWELIGVAEICRQAQVHRATFYAHFEDKSDLLERGLSMLFDGLVNAPGTTQPVSMEGQFEALLRHGEAHREFYLAALDQGGALRRLFTDYLTAHARDAWRQDGPHAGPVQELLARFGAGAIIGVLEWYLRASPPLSTEEVARLMAKGLRSGLEAETIG